MSSLRHTARRRRGVFTGYGGRGWRNYHPLARRALGQAALWAPILPRPTGGLTAGSNVVARAGMVCGVTLTSAQAD